MENKDNKQSSQQDHSTGQPDHLELAAVPTTLVPSVLNRLGLADRQMMKGDQVLAALQDERSSVRVAAIRSLEEHREVSSSQFLIFALHDPAWEVRVAAVWALNAFGDHAPIEPLIETLADEDASVRAAALRVLAGKRGQVSPESLAHMRNDADWLVREAAASTIEELGEQAPTERLVTRLYDEKTVIRETPQMSQKRPQPEVRPSTPLTSARAMQFQVMADRYQLQEPIGRGGMATIYRCQDLQMNRTVAIKVLRELYNTDPKFVARFQREAKAASALKHPNIVEVYDYGQSEGNYYISMELVEGTDLRRYLRSRRILDVDRAVIIAHDVALGLAAAHRRKIVHRDIKPQNILVGRNGSIKLTDFGIVSVYQDINARRLTTTGMTLGTVQYYAPEQALGEIVSPAADVYELGIVMYEMLTGRTPFDGDLPVTVAMQHIQDDPIPPSQLNPSIPAAFEEIILHCLEKDPEKRFQDGSQLARALEKLGDAKLSASIPATPVPAPILSTSQKMPSGPDNTRRSSNKENVLPDFIAAFTDNNIGLNAPAVPNNAGHIPASLTRKPLYVDRYSSAHSPDSASFHRFQPGSIRSSVVLPPRKRKASISSIMAICIPLAILLLLAIGTYVAAELGFINLPFINTATQSSTQYIVPDLIGLPYQTAINVASTAGFSLQAKNNITTGVVISQSPRAYDKAPKTQPIIVGMGQLTSTSTTVPSHVVGNTLARAEQILSAAHIPYTLKSAGTDPAKGPNTVKSVSPPEGSPLPPGQSVTLYVVNLTNGT